MKRSSNTIIELEVGAHLDLLRPFDRLWGVQAQHKSLDELLERHGTLDALFLIKKHTN